MAFKNVWQRPEPRDTTLTSTKGTVFFYDAQRCFRHLYHNSPLKKPRPTPPPRASPASRSQPATQPSREGELESSPGWAAAAFSLFDLLRDCGALGKGARTELDGPETGGRGKGLLREMRERQLELGSH